MLNRVLLVASMLVLAPCVCRADSFRTNTRSFVGLQECTMALWDTLQALSGDKAILRRDRSLGGRDGLELVDEAGERVLVRAGCEEALGSSFAKARFRGFIEFP